MNKEDNKKKVKKYTFLKKVWKVKKVLYSYINDN